MPYTEEDYEELEEEKDNFRKLSKILLRYLPLGDIYKVREELGEDREEWFDQWFTNWFDNKYPDF